MTDALVAARVVAFAAPAALSTTQDIVRLVRPALGAGADASVVAEETLALVATLTARAAETGLQCAAPRSPRPARPSPSCRSSTTTTCSVRRWWPRARGRRRAGRERVRAAGAQGGLLRRPPAARALSRPVRARAELPLWMGRISPPRLPTNPDERLGALGVADLLAVHTRLVLAFAQKAAEEPDGGDEA